MPSITLISLSFIFILSCLFSYMNLSIPVYCFSSFSIWFLLSGIFIQASKYAWRLSVECCFCEAFVADSLLWLLACYKYISALSLLRCFFYFSFSFPNPSINCSIQLLIYNGFSMGEPVEVDAWCSESSRDRRSSR